MSIYHQRWLLWPGRRTRTCGSTKARSPRWMRLMGALGGIVAWYSIIHTPPEELPVVFAEFHRVLAPDGHLLLTFQVGDEPRQLRRRSAMRCRSTATAFSQIESYSGYMKPGLPYSHSYCASPTRPRRSGMPTFWPGNRP
ncbi:MAG: hypothetical protein QOG46_672 [Pseudonocardiales bacterium]|nr:hypothetical protein [Pseudonocardiales bacterium]